MFKCLRAILNNTKNGQPYLTIGHRDTANLLLDSIKLKFLEIKEHSPPKQTREFGIQTQTTKKSDNSQSNTQQEQQSFAKVAQKVAGGGQQPKHLLKHPSNPVNPQGTCRQERNSQQSQGLL
ncbi:hypothetical protein AVEN_219072-1 [Araneus ventricosus]|uniref:Uncharacterized protein n=1 Tax=Araneus ventricosus TaxID=182803 RepID=A0A4Y2G9L6_ARAVE|nr:hypothetical protein AVEN_219072-1 [Araneus ventricosus]